MNRIGLMSENAKKVFTEKYCLKNDDFETIETIEECFKRVSSFISKKEDGTDDIELNQKFFDMLSNFEFLPNSPTFTGADTKLGQLAACFVLPISDDLISGSSSIFNTKTMAASIQQLGGGNGFSFSRLREKGKIIKTSKGKASGPISFLKSFDFDSETIKQGGTRRGANMAVLRVDHPDIIEFIECKSKEKGENRITNFNISVALTNDFMEKLKTNSDYDLISPYDNKKVRSENTKKIFDLICKNAYEHSEPGVLFIDNANEKNPVPHLYDLESTNPCGLILFIYNFFIFKFNNFYIIKKENNG